MSDFPSPGAPSPKTLPTTLFILRKREALSRRMGRVNEKSRQSI